MNKFSGSAPIVVFILAAMLFVFSSVPAMGAPTSPSSSRIIPPLNTTVMQDPSGTYWFTNLNDGQYSTNVATYEQLLQDPFAGISDPQVQIAGDTVLMTTTPAESSSSYLTLNGTWGGAAGCFGTFSNSQYGLQCSNPTDTMNISQVYVTSLSWNNQCWGGGTSCWTGFWTGESGTYSGQAPLIQNGIGVCISNTHCPNGGSSGGTTWELWYELPPSNPVPTSTYPTTINSSQYEFQITWFGAYQVNFFWCVGTWSTSTTVNVSVSQTSFVQSEGIFETPGAGALPLVTWSPTSPVLTGWYRGAGYYQTAPCGNYGSSYNTAYYNVEVSSSYEAYGYANPNNGYTFIVQHT